MEQTMAALTVFFEEPFWVGVYERTEGGRYTVCKVTFGAEPREPEVYAFFLKNWGRLRCSPSMQVQNCAQKRPNPKRMQRAIKKQLQADGVGTKAQKALKLQQEQGKIERKTTSRAAKEAQQEHIFALRQQKRREKHKGH